MFSKADNGFSTERNCLWSVGNAVLCFGKQTNKKLCHRLISKLQDYFFNLNISLCTPN